MRHVRLAVLMLGWTAVLSAASPFVGVWKLNVAKSDFKAGLPPKEQIAYITESGDTTRIRLEGIAADGTPTLVDYTIPTNGGLGKMSQSSAYDGVSAKMFAPGEREISRLKDGKVIYTVLGKVSPDGKSISTVSKGVSPLGKPVEANLFYDRVK